MVGGLFHLKPQSNSSWRIDGIEQAMGGLVDLPANKLPAFTSRCETAELRLMHLN